MQKLSDSPRQLRNLFEIVHFTEQISTKIYGKQSQEEIFQAIRNEFSKSKKYSMSICMLVPKTDLLRLDVTSIAHSKLKVASKATGLMMDKFHINLGKSAIYRQVAKYGRTVHAKPSTIVAELLPRPAALVVSKLLGYGKERSIITPIRKGGKIVGAFAMTSTEPAAYFTPSVRNLALHISTALDLADESTRRLKSEQALKRSEGRYRLLFECIGDPVTVHYITQDELPGLFVEANEVACRKLGYTKDEFLCLSPGHIEAPENLEPMAKLRNRILADRAIVAERIFVTKEGQRIPFEINGHLFELEGRPAMITIAHDLTQRKRMEKSLQEHQKKLESSEQSLREFSRKVLDIREDEAKRMSINLHDELGSMAVSLGSSLALAEEDMREGNRESALQSLGKTKETVKRSIERLKKMAAGLRPPDLEIVGLSGALQGYFADVSRQTGMRINFRTQVQDKKVHEKTAIVLYRVAQEAINNAVKHADARHVDVTLEKGKHGICLRVVDNGKGFDPDRTLLQPASTNLGLQGMKERVHALHGHFAIQSGLGQGTEVIASVPNP